MKYAHCLKILASVITLTVMQTSAVEAALIIDTFTDRQQVKDKLFSSGASDSSMALSGSSSSLTGVQRTFSATADGSPNSNVEKAKNSINTHISAENGLLSFSNSEKSNGTASILYDNFGTIDFTRDADAFLIEILKIDLNAELALIINNNSFSDPQLFNSAGSFYIDFISFSNPSELASVQNFALIIKGVEALDFDFKFSAVNRTGSASTAAVPEPSLYALLAIGLLVFGALKRTHIQF
ncbi:PEP-CTERM sorting domain-containing protein [Methylicorpusculum oleiharenae]|uniref:PEP-CTERM sorting domain-containing protein n=1 Tax=Methylicorpusculum oleiharenae TaxID=1338687 RepID=UPI001356785A|nr:PEP-CTERM sorting domain-containing protein [Methylicorpusculum oleiharenae]MCD2449218.1 PEP-CTERM sorting domain-containing protein [Methylicorpusculum oleiharenae]